MGSPGGGASRNSAASAAARLPELRAGRGARSRSRGQELVVAAAAAAARRRRWNAIALITVTF